MPFGRDEHSTRQAKLAALRAWLAESGAPAVVLTRAGPVAWLTGGLTNPVERGNPGSPLWIVVRADDAFALTSDVEAPRLEDEGDLQMPIERVSWFDPDELVALAVRLAGAPAGTLASDGEPSFGVDASDELAILRLRLAHDEQVRLRALGRDAAMALEESLRAFRPGERDRDVQARIADALERRGALAVCLIVGGDERVERFRHPLAVDAPVHRLVMAVVVAERGGLHAAATRYVSATSLPPPLRASRAAALDVEEAMLAATRARASYGDVLRVCDEAYAAAGYRGAWREHYQGGPIAYRQREFEIAPSQASTSRFAQVRVEHGHAVAWNPSVRGGGKAEDTYLVVPSGLERLTDSGSWPTLQDGRPAVLDLSTGRSAEVAA